ncbi:MAG TPA: hypothetical protein VNH18_27870 [Bryobacteraceae bacterium]|nr:hypothetical protein [Bryobacteraceae bacterium]
MATEWGFVEQRDGGYAYTEPMLGVLDLIRRALSRLHGVPHRTVVAPPVIASSIIARTSYPACFPQLLAAVSTLNDPSLVGDAMSYSKDAAAAWRAGLAPSRWVLQPAACYSVYALLADSRLNEPYECDVTGWCFRNESTSNATRLSSFEMREFVHVGTADSCAGFVDFWRAEITSFLSELELLPRVVPAADPFFGRGALLLARSQLQSASKVEFVVEAESGPLAVASLNSHGNALTEQFNIHCGDNATASACMAFGLHRLARSLLWVHGEDVNSWPNSILPTIGL